MVNVGEGEGGTQTGAGIEGLILCVVGFAEGSSGRMEMFWRQKFDTRFYALFLTTNFNTSVYFPSDPVISLVTQKIFKPIPL
jgi:hypothetical protein